MGIATFIVLSMIALLVYNLADQHSARKPVPVRLSAQERAAALLRDRYARGDLGAAEYRKMLEIVRR